MRQITQRIVNAFQNSRPLLIGNSRTNGESLWLFGNKIAEIRRDGLWITNAGWTSTTTKERLNGLSGVNIVQRRGNWYLNGRAWDGRWVNVDAWNDGIEYVTGVSVPEENEPEFDVTSEWVEDGYSKPIYSVFHTLVKDRLEEAEQILNKHGIQYRRMESDTDGVYRPNYFIVVKPAEHQNASWLLNYLQELVN